MNCYIYLENLGDAQIYCILLLIFQGCMSDIRVNGEWFPMDKMQNKNSRAADVLARSQNTVEGCSSEMCLSPAGLKCPPNLICIDIWRYAECRQDLCSFP